MFGKIKKGYFVLDTIILFLFCSLFYTSIFSEFYFPYIFSWEVLASLVFYSILKSIMGIILFLVNIIKKNRSQKLKKILLIPAILLELFIIVCFLERFLHKRRLDIKEYIYSILFMLSILWVIYIIKNAKNNIIVYASCILTPLSILIYYFEWYMA